MLVMRLQQPTRFQIQPSADHGAHSLPIRLFNLMAQLRLHLLLLVLISHVQNLPSKTLILNRQYNLRSKRQLLMVSHTSVLLLRYQSPVEIPTQYHRILR